MKARALCLATALLFSAANSADALTTFTVTNDRSGTNTFTVPNGETVTIRVRLSNGTNVFGLGASAFGYSESVIDFTSGQAVSSINHGVAIPAVGFFSGLANANVTAPAPGTVSTGPLIESAIGANGNRVSFFSGVGLAGTNSNVADPGLNGDASDAQFEFIFTADGNNSGTTLIDIGTGYAGDGEVGAGGSLDQTANVRLNITVPEPAVVAAGMTALASVAGVVMIRRRV